MRFWILILSVVYCQEKIDSKQVFNSTIYMSTLAEKAMKSIRYYIEVSQNFTRSRDSPTQASVTVLSKDMENTEILSILPKSEKLVDRLVDKALNRLSYNLFFHDKQKNRLCMADVYVTFISRNDGKSKNCFFFGN